MLNILYSGHNMYLISMPQFVGENNLLIYIWGKRKRKNGFKV